MLLTSFQLGVRFGAKMDTKVYTTEDNISNNCCQVPTWAYDSARKHAEYVRAVYMSQLSFFHCALHPLLVGGGGGAIFWIFFSPHISWKTFFFGRGGRGPTLTFPDVHDVFLSTQPPTVACKNGSLVGTRTRFFFFALCVPVRNARSVHIDKSFCVGAQSEVY